MNHSNTQHEIPIDYGDVLERIGGDLAFLEELLKIYFVEFRQKKNQIEGALKSRDFPQIQDLGHSLKGASANLSLVTLQRVAHALEAAGRDGNIVEAGKALAGLVAECGRLESYLRENPPADPGL